MPATLNVAVEQVGPSTAKGTARTHSVLIDRPVAKGGADLGPLGGELLLLALGGCFMSNVLAAVRAREAAVTRVTVAVAGDVAASPDRFEAIRMEVDAQAEDRDLLAKLVEIAERACIVTNTLRLATPITIRIAKRD
jgi:putative redox protein